jgi:hypothetical protein
LHDGTSGPVSAPPLVSSAPTSKLGPSPPLSLVAVVVVDAPWLDDSCVVVSPVLVDASGDDVVDPVSATFVVASS